jgi:hypothetical protein
MVPAIRLVGFRLGNCKKVWDPWRGCWCAERRSGKIYLPRHDDNPSPSTGKPVHVGFGHEDLYGDCADVPGRAGAK